MKEEVVFYKREQGTIEVRIESNLDTVWLNGNQLALLFERDLKTIGKHIADIFKEGELDREVGC